MAISFVLVSVLPSAAAAVATALDTVLVVAAAAALLVFVLPSAAAVASSSVAASLQHCSHLLASYYFDLDFDAKFVFQLRHDFVPFFRLQRIFSF